MRVRIVEDLCSACEMCVDACPGVFELDEHDEAQVKVDPVPPEFEEACREAAEPCPSEAFIIEG
jgi:ferredoxin